MTHPGQACGVLHASYRVTPAGNGTPRPAWFSERLALRSFLGACAAAGPGVRVVFVADGGVPAELADLVRDAGPVVPVRGGDAPRSHRALLRVARQVRGDGVVWFAEDDYLYRPEALRALRTAAETLPAADYFGLDTPDDTAWHLDHASQPGRRGPQERHEAGGTAWQRAWDSTSTFGLRTAALHRDAGLLELRSRTGGPWDGTTVTTVQGVPSYAWRHRYGDLYLRPSRASAQRVVGRPVLRALANLAALDASARWVSPGPASRRTASRPTWPRGPTGSRSPQTCRNRAGDGEHSCTQHPVRRSTVRAPALLRLALVGVALTSTAGLAAAAEETSSPLTLHFRNTGTECATGNPFLSPDKGNGKDINCGYIGGGLPFGEVLSAAGADASRSFSTVLPESEDEAVPTFRLDDAKALTAKVVVQAGSQQGVPLPGAGQVRVVLELTGTTADGDTVPLGGGDSSVVATPAARTVEVPFSVDLADAVGDVDLVAVTATLTTRGVHVFHGFAQMGTSTLTLPVVDAPAAPPAVQG